MRRNTLLYSIAFVLLLLIILFLNKTYNEITTYAQLTNRHKEIEQARLWMTLFIALSGLILIYTTGSYFKQQSKTIVKQKELETVLNRIDDAVVSVDNEWRYTFLNDAAMATHPLGKKETLGKVIWDIHPEMKGTVFWDKYHEAMLTRKVVEIENYYPPLDTWFSVKVYPSPDGLTIFYKNVTDSKRADQQLSKTVKEVTDYKFALDESSIVAITDQKGIIKHANQNFCKISKYSAEELIGQDHRIINSGYHSKEFIKNLWATIANGKIWKGELKNKAKDGTVYWVDTTIVPFLDEAAKPYQYVAIRSDITERKSIEENLEKSLKETSDYKYALEESSIVAITDQKGIIKFANDNFCKISKYNREELIGQDHRIINSGYHPKEFIKNLWTTIANGKIWKGELKNKAKDGTIYWVDTTIVPFLDEKGKPYQYVAIRADITERKLAEENLLASLKEIADYKYALDESSIVAITDQKGIIRYANENFCKISKYTAGELIGQDHRIINSGYHPKEFIKNLWTTIANGKIWKGELKNKAKDGTIYWVDTTIVPFLDEKEKPYQYVAIRADITERKQGEEKIIDLNIDLEKKIKERTQQLKKSNEELETFSYSVSHDLRAPLRGIIGFASILEEDYGNVLDDEGKRITAVIKSNTIKMGQLIDDLLAFSRMGRQDILKTNIDTSKMVEEVIEELTPRVKKENIHWTIHSLPKVNGDLNTIRQVWINLISNAMKYSGNKEKQCIEIGFADQGRQFVFYVKDNGVGFDEKYKDKLFKVFQRLHGAEEFEGTGVGLALVEKIISKHGGKVWAEGKTNEGACFYFSLPA